MNCAKELSITIAGLSPAAWWAMESAGASLIDATGQSNMTLTGLSNFPATTQAGKVALAATLVSDSGFARYTTGAVSNFGFDGTDINIFGWTRVDAIPFNNLQQFIIFSDLFNSVTLRFNGNGTYTVSRGGTILSGFFTVGVFTFWRLTYAAATQKWGIEFNNSGVVTYAAGTQAVVVGNASMDLQFSNGFNPPYFQQCDELCVFRGAMLQSDIDDIYNAGAGRTFP